MPASSTAVASAVLPAGGPSRPLPRVVFQMPDEVVATHDPVSSFTRTSPAAAQGNMQALSITDASVIDRWGRKGLV